MLNIAYLYLILTQENCLTHFIPLDYLLKTIFCFSTQQENVTQEKLIKHYLEIQNRKNKEFKNEVFLYLSLMDARKAN